MRRSEKKWMERDELTTPFLAPESDENPASVATELRDRMVKVEQQVLAQYTATAAYATLAQQGAEHVRAEGRADLDRTQSTIIGLLDRLRDETTMRLDALSGRPASSAAELSSGTDDRLTLLEDRMNAVLNALETTRRDNTHLRAQVDELLQRQMQEDGWLVSNGSASELRLG
jgi:hypothetical protein